ncbi:MAG: carbohydrate kinase family protein [Verrucomicrobia bacterium]|nr:carbohydrate kinase family protein [Verrucomicrobiota bacterium]
MASKAAAGRDEGTLDVVCLGMIVADVVAKPVAGLPEQGDTREVDYLNLHNGGDTSNVAVNLAKLSVRSGIICKVGDDHFGAFLTAALRENGVEASHVIVDRNVATAACLALVRPDGERSFFYKGDANDRLTSGDVDFDYVSRSTVLHTGGTLLLGGLDGEPLAGVLKEARRRGITTSMDVAWDTSGRWLGKIAPCLEHLDIFLPSHDEAREIAGLDEPEAIGRFFLNYGIGIVGVKLGPRGAYVTDGERAHFVPSLVKPRGIVDTTGAGDAFVAGFLAAHLRGWDLERCARFASAVSAVCIGSLGTTTWQARVADIERLAGVR